MDTTPAALIADFGGVLTTDLWASVRGCARRLGVPEDTFVRLLHDDPQIRPMFVGLERGEVSQADFEVRLAAAAGVPSERLLERLCADLRPDEAMLKAVEVLRGAGVKVGVLSNSWGTGYFDPYRGYDLASRADVVILSDRVGLRKPERAIFELMLRRLGVRADRAVFVDDVAANLPPAEAMGMRVIHHVDTGKTIEALAQAFAVDLSAARG